VDWLKKAKTQQLRESGSATAVDGPSDSPLTAAFLVIVVARWYSPSTLDARAGTGDGTRLRGRLAPRRG
jgi:hypothetical protein